MQVSFLPEKKEWKNLLKRPTADFADIEIKVSPILKEVRNRGDVALSKFALEFDNILLDHFEVEESIWKTAANETEKELQEAINFAYQNIHTFHSSQLKPSTKIETMPGVVCWRKQVPIEKVGIYIPGGTAPLFSTVLMLGIPAKIAGCKEIILCSPSNNPAIYYAAMLCGVTKVYRLGGAQAIAAMAYGTETVRKVDKIFGPGNQYVTAAKQLVSKEGMAIDMPAGPSEVAVFADHTGNASFIASDLLSQAEHGMDSQVLFVTTEKTLIHPVQKELLVQVESLPRKDFAKKALENSRAILVDNLETAADILNEYAAEHLILACENAETFSSKIFNAGSIFLGHYTPESCGDYASGTNHTLPTNGFAKAYSGVSLDSFMKNITFQEISKEGLRGLSKTVITMAKEEQLLAHARAVEIRLQDF